MTPFEKLFVAHLVGDWILAQSDWEAMNKAKNWLACLTHASKWTLILFGAIVFWVGKPLTWPLMSVLLVMGALHAVIDRRWPVTWLMRVKEYIPLGYHIMAPTERREPPFWLVICVDQVLHIVQIAIIASLL